MQSSQESPGVGVFWDWQKWHLHLFACLRKAPENWTMISTWTHIPTSHSVKEFFKKSMWQLKKTTVNNKKSFFSCHICFIGNSEAQTSCTCILVPHLNIFVLACLIPIQRSFTDLLLWDNVACLSKIILAFGIMQEWGKEIPFQHSISCPANNFQSSTRKKPFVWNPRRSLWDLKGDANLKKLG